MVGGALVLLLAFAIVAKRPLLVAMIGGVLGGPTLYASLGAYLARERGEGRFYSWPVGGYHVGDLEVLLSAGMWGVVTGAAAYAGARLLCPRTP